MTSKTPRTDAYIGNDNEDYMTEGEVAMCDFSRGLEIELSDASEEIAELKAKKERLREVATYEHAGCTASAMGWAIKYVAQEATNKRLTEVIRAATVLIAAKGRHNTMLAYEGLRSLL